MSEKIGPLTVGKHHRLAYLGVEGAEERNYSEETARIIDAEVRDLIEEGHRRAKKFLTEGRKTLDALAGLLLEKEVINGEDVIRVVRSTGGEGRSPR